MCIVTCDFGRKNRRIVLLSTRLWYNIKRAVSLLNDTTHEWVSLSVTEIKDHAQTCQMPLLISSYEHKMLIKQEITQVSITWK